ncbi:MAG TPA: PP0621 family protein [Methylomirabilota bacterium]|nr:PP0621 family protein [Methylomirabilota bacterium]
MLLRLLFFFLLAYVIVSALKAYVIGRKSGSRQRHTSTNSAEEMVFDPQCQSYVPKGEAILQGGNYFCSRECAKLFLSR